MRKDASASKVKKAAPGAARSTPRKVSLSSPRVKGEPRPPRVPKQKKQIKSAPRSAVMPRWPDPIGSSSFPIESKSGRSSNVPHSHRTGLRTAHIQTIVLGATPTTGTLIYTRRNTASAPNTYLEQYTQMYSRWRPHRLEYEFIPSYGTGTAGTLAYATDPDPLSGYADPASNVQRMSSLPGYELRQVWQRMKFRSELAKDFTDLWCMDLNPLVDDYSDRLTAAGNTLIVVVAPGAMVAGDVVGTLILHYDYTFYSPRIGPTALSQPSSMKISWAEIFPYFFPGLSTDAATAPVLAAVFQWFSDKFGTGSGSTDSTTQSLLGEFIKAFFEYVPWFSFAEASKGKPFENCLLTRGKNILGPAPTEISGLSPGSFDVKMEIVSNDDVFDSNCGWNTAYTNPFGNIGTAYVGAATRTVVVPPVALNAHANRACNDNGVVSSFGPINSSITNESYMDLAATEWSFTNSGYRGFLDYSFAAPTSSAGRFPPSTTANTYLLVRFTPKTNTRFTNTTAVGVRACEMEELSFPFDHLLFDPDLPFPIPKSVRPLSLKRTKGVRVHPSVADSKSEEKLPSEPPRLRRSKGYVDIDPGDVDDCDLLKMFIKDWQSRADTEFPISVSPLVTAEQAAANKVHPKRVEYLARVSRFSKQLVSLPTKA